IAVPPVTPVVQAGHFTFTWNFPTTGQIRAVGDFNRDGILDVALATLNSNLSSGSSDTMAVLLGNGDGSFTVSQSLPYFPGDIFAVVDGDFNNDGLLDLAVAIPTENAIGILLGNGDGTFQAPIMMSPVSGRALTVGDFDRDGNLDLVTDIGGVDGMSEYPSSSQSEILLGNGDGTFHTAANPFLS